jgi:hypothetical protein
MTYKLTLLAGAAAALYLPALAEVAVGGGIGTTGGIIEGQYGFNEYVTVRGGFNFFSYGIDEEYDDVEYDADLDLSNIGAFVDLHPFANSFLVTAGGYFGDKTIDGTGRPTQPVQIGNTVYTPAQIGTLTLDAKANDAAPFLGIGYDNTFRTTGNWGFKIIGGAMFSGEPDVSLQSDGGVFSGDPTFEAEVDREEQRIRDDIEDFKVYPVVQIGVTYRFGS